jgi:hypothetical protein
VRKGARPVEMPDTTVLHPVFPKVARSLVRAVEAHYKAQEQQTQRTKDARSGKLPEKEAKAQEFRV